MEHWYTLHTKPRTEYQVSQSLQTRGVQTYLPEIEASSAHQGRTVEPLFPCYLFVKLDFETVGLLQVAWTPGLRRIVGFGDRPAPLADEVIDGIQRRLENDDAAADAAGAWPRHALQPGDSVRITHGPLSDLLAVVEGPTAPAERVQVLLKFLGRASRAHVSVSDLEKIRPEAGVPIPKRSRRTRGRGRRTKTARNRSQAEEE
jgi:transcriptional antiterminator RfaH